MRKLVYILVFVSTSLVSQENFKIVDNTVLWEKTFEESLNIKSIEKEVLTNPNKDNFRQIDNIVTYESFNNTLNYVKYGGKRINTPIYCNEKFNYLVVIEINKDSYKVKIKDINILLDNEYVDLSNFTTRKGKFKKSQETALNYYNQYFLETI